VVEMFPASEIAATFRRLAERLLGNEKRAVPTPLSEERLSELRAEVRLRMRRRLKTEDKR
ncbi:MAG: hypothetical protein OD815_001885, partial [Candidatus Alkanophagales archaeon MCA70_species_2]|nr:hypothetical protein [Candidatus Alkanophaga liquidiphilum]